MKHLSKLAIPGAVLLLAVLVLQRPHALADPMLGTFVRAYAYAVALTGLLLGWLFVRSRIVFAILILAVADWALSEFAACVPAAEGLGRAVFAAVALLLPLNFAACAMMTDRGILSVRSLLLLLPLLLQVLLVAWICRLSHYKLAAWLESGIVDSRLTAWTSIPQPALLAFGLALVLQTTRFIRHRNAIESGFLWALGAAFMALSGDPVVGWLSTTYLATAGLILIVSLLVRSYRMAYYDELTDLPARRALNDELLRLGKRYAVALVDVDHFKSFNDKYGHDVGDQVLRMVASKLGGVSGGGKAYRYGGEEFALLFRGKSLKDVRPSLEKLRKTIEATPFFLRGRGRPRVKPAEPRPDSKARKEVSVTVSIGAAERGDRKQEPKEVIKAADEALYRAKDAGRNQVQS